MANGKLFSTGCEFWLATSHRHWRACSACLKQSLGGGVELALGQTESKLSRQSAANWLRRRREGGSAVCLTCLPIPQFPMQHLYRTEGLHRTTVPPTLDRYSHRQGHQLEPGPRQARANPFETHDRSFVSWEPTFPVVRCEHPAPADLRHIDIKNLARS